MEYIYLLACLGVIVFSANWLVAGSVVVAKRFKISDFVIGAVIVGVGTSFPELVVSTLGAIDGNSAIAIGNVVGSNIFNIMGILGLTAMVAPVAVSRENKRFDLPFCLAVSVLALLLVFNFFTGGEAMISRADSFVLLAIFLLFMYLSLRGNKKNEAEVVSGVICAPTPSMSRRLKMFEPTTLPSANCVFFFAAAASEAASSGIEVPQAMRVIEMKASFTPHDLAIATALSRNISLASTKATKPKSSLHTP